MTDEVRNLSSKLGIDTTDFKTAIAGANRELRVLESGFRAGAAGLQDWSKDATGLEMRIKSLTGQMDVQKLKVDALRAEHQRLAEASGVNSRAAKEAEINLNKETATLNKMELELKQDNQALVGLKDGSDKAAEGIKKVETASVSGKDAMLALGGAAKTSVAALLAVVGVALAVAGAVGGLVLSTANASAELTDMSVKTGISTTALQEYNYIANQTGTTLDTITGAQAKLVKGMAGARDEQQKYSDALNSMKPGQKAPELGAMAQAFKDLGVSTTGAGGSLRNADDVFKDAIDALGRIQNPAERDALAMQIFGKSAQELNPLIKAGSAELAKLTKNAHEMGAVMSEEDVAAGAELMDTIDSMKDGFGGITGTLASQLIPLFMYLATALKKVFSSDEFKAGLKAAVEGLKEFSSWAITNIPLIIQQVQAMMPVIVGVLAAIGAAILAFVYTVVIPSAIASITAILPIIAAMLPIIAICAAIGLAVGLLYAAWTADWSGMSANFAEFMASWNAGVRGWQNFGAGFSAKWKEGIAGWQNYFAGVRNQSQASWSAGTTGWGNYFAGLRNQSQSSWSAGIAGWSNYFSGLRNQTQSSWSDGLAGWSNYFSGLGNVFAQGWSNALASAQDFLNDLPNMISNAAGDLLDAGGELVQGLWDGITAGWRDMLADFQELVDLLPQAIKDVLGIHSRSTVGYKLGTFFSQGLGDGMMDELQRAQRAMNRALNGFGPGMGLAGMGAGGGLAAVSNNDNSLQLRANQIIFQGPQTQGTIGAAVRQKARRY